MRPLFVAAFAATALAAGLPVRAALAEDPPPAAAEASAQQQFDAVKAEFDKARADVSKEMTGKPREEQQKIFEEKAPKPEEWAPRFLAIADKYPKDAAALSSLLWVAQNVPKPEVQAKALDRILADHVADPAVGKVCMSLQSSQAPNAETFLRTVAEKNPDRTAQAMAIYGLVKMYGYRKQVSASLKEGDPDLRAKAEKFFGKEATDRLEKFDSAAASKKQEELLDQLVAKYADVKLGRSTVGEQVQNELFEMRTLGVGKTAPEIEGADVDGKAMKLSDYRGKVVVLDFFGFW